MQFIENPKITDPKGYTGAAVHAGFKRKRKDLCILKSDVPAIASVKFTTNMVKAAPVLLGMESLKHSGNVLQALVINGGNANAGTGDQGKKDALQTAEWTADLLDIAVQNVLVSSTGVIGNVLDMEKMSHGLQKVAAHLSVKNGAECAEAILTTDTTEKSFGVQIDIQGVIVTLSGITKGSGMIQPNMATTLAYVTTDATIDHSLLDEIFTECVNKSYNMITVDGHTSTNDTALIMANGLAENPLIKAATPDANIFSSALMELMMKMAQSIIRDGEGATKFVEVRVNQVDSYENARKMAFGIANSVLVKTAFFGEDPNWGRILSAAGMVGVSFNPDDADLHINGCPIFLKGNPLKLNHQEMKKIMAETDIRIDLDIHSGGESALVYTSDLSYDYVKINAEYHT